MKADTRAPQDFYLNIEVPKKTMEVLHIDLIEVNGKFVITVLDRLSKCAWLVFLTATDSRSVAAMFNGKPRAGNSREFPVSRETGGKFLDLGNSRVSGISREFPYGKFPGGKFPRPHGREGTGISR